jgi:hypothetical protein
MDSLFSGMSFDSFLPVQSNVVTVTKERKQVTFHERVKVVEVPNARFLPPKEKKALWYPEPVEYKKSNKIKQLMCAIDFEADCSNEEGRDEEDDIDENGRRRRLPVVAVLEEQRNQREMGTEPDSHFVAKIYTRCSAHSVTRARRRALQDELEAKEYLSKWTSSSNRRFGSKLFRRNCNELDSY